MIGEKYTGQRGEEAVRPVIAMIAAIGANGVIGREGEMPWRLPSDLRHFKALTLGHPVIMGRKTFESLGKPLPGRANIIVTRDKEFALPGVQVCHSLEEAIRAAESAPGGAQRCFIIGGGQIYRLAMDLADELHVTHVDAEPVGDTRFPAIEPRLWRVREEKMISREEGDSADMRLVVYERT